MMRISRQQMFMQIAHVVSQRSTCFRLNVGAIIVIGNQIVSIGYNGQSAGEDHCERLCLPGACNTIHAEANAIRRLKHFSARRSEVQMYCTDSPCLKCAEDIAEHCGVLYFSRPYRDEAPLKYLQDLCDVRVIRILPSGAEVNWSC